MTRLSGIPALWSHFVNWVHVFTYAGRFLFNASPRRRTRTLGARGRTRAVPPAKRVYVSLTTIPSRVSRIPEVLANLDLDLVEKVFLAVPEVFARDGAKYEIPAEYAAIPKLEILRSDRDYGPITKLVPAARHLRAHDPRSLLIVLDDDQDYPRGLVAELVFAQRAAGENAVVCGSGQRYSLYGLPEYRGACGGRHYRIAPGTTLAEVDVVEGYGGVILPVPLVDADRLESLAARSRACFHSDDVVISAGLAEAGVPRWRIARSPYFHVGLIRPRAYGLRGDALFRVGSRHRERWRGVFDNQHARNYREALSEIASAPR